MELRPSFLRALLGPRVVPAARPLGGAGAEELATVVLRVDGVRARGPGPEVAGVVGRAQGVAGQGGGHVGGHRHGAGVVRLVFVVAAWKRRVKVFLAGTAWLPMNDHTECLFSLKGATVRPSINKKLFKRKPRR